MNKQEMFDKAYIGVITQGGPSFVHEGTTRDGVDKVACAYRSAEGNKCAFGHLIPDELYTDALEGIRVSGLQQRGSIEFKTWLEQTLPDDEGYHFVSLIQHAHDKPVIDSLRISDWSTSFITKFKTAMHTIAAEYKLTIPQL